MSKAHSELFVIITARPTLMPTPHSEAWDHTCRASGSLGYSTAHYQITLKVIGPKDIYIYTQSIRTSCTPKEQ